MGKEQPKPRLGRGLASLLGAVAENNTTEESASSGSSASNSTVKMKSNTAVVVDSAITDVYADLQLSDVTGSKQLEVAGQSFTISVDRVKPNPYQPRLQIDPEAMAEMVESIRNHGVVQPIVVRPIYLKSENKDGGNGRPRASKNFELVAGQRRLAAVRQLGLDEIPAIIREADDQQMLELALVENIHREDLNCVDRALAYKNYQDSFTISAEVIAERLGQDRTTVTNYLRLLSLPDEVLDLLRRNKLSMGHARAIVGLDNPKEQIKAALKIAELGMSVRQTESMISKLKKAAKAGGSASQTISKNPNVVDLEQQMMRSLSTKVQIKPARKKGAGKVVIEYYTLDDFDRILDKVCGKERQEF